MRPSWSARFKRPHRILHSCGSRCSRAPIVFQDGRERVSCFMFANSRSSDSVHARESDSPGRALASGGRMLNDPRLPSLRSGEVTGLGVKVTVGVSGIVDVFSMGAGGAAAVVALSERVRIEAAR